MHNTEHTKWNLLGDETSIAIIDAAKTFILKG
jgi:hypothetical protein